MKFLFLAMTLISVSSLFAETIFNKNSGKLVIQGESAENVSSIYNALRSISEKFKVNRSLEPCSHYECSIEFSKLPDFFNITFLEAPEEVYCYNAPLALYGRAKPLSVSTEEDFEVFVNKSCKRTISPRPGDVGAVLHNFGDKSYFRHVFIYITDEVYYEKANSGSHPFNFVNYKKSLSPYLGTWEEIDNEWILTGVNESCVNPENNRACDDVVIYYSCDIVDN